MRKQDLEKIGACVASSEACARLVEHYYLPLAEDTLQVDRLLKRRLSADRARKIADGMPPDWLESVYNILLAHECFKARGFFEKNPELEARAGRDVQTRLLCEAFHENPWRYTFCRVVKARGDHLFEMQDELTREKFELYSKSVSLMMDEHGASVLFGFLRFWNGHCWQTYFGIFYFLSFDARDLVSFATVLDSGCRDAADAVRVLERNLLDFLLLFRFGEVPFITHQNRELRFLQSTLRCGTLPLESLEKDFEIQKKQGVYHLQLKPYPDRMRIAEMYWSPKNRELVLESSETDLDRQLREALRKNGIAVAAEPDLDMSLAMESAISALLQKDLRSGYARRFEKPATGRAEENREPLNRFMELLADRLNHKRPYVLEELARQTGIELAAARSLERDLLNRIYRPN